jgi:PAS domain S-box-containing protein
MTEVERLQQEIDFLKQEKVAYEETNHRFTAVFELSRLGNKIIDQDLTILQVNQSLVTMLGYENKEDIIGTRIFDYAPADRREDWRFLQQKLWANLTPSFSLETCLLRKDGSLIWCQVTSILIPENGKRLGYTILEDVTEQHNLRLQREEFISVASHELKTPITSLNATLQIMNQIINVKPEMPTELVKFSQNAQRHVTKLINLVEDLLNTTKIERGQLALNKTIFTVSEMIDDCCGHIRLAGEYEIIYQGDRSLKVFADQFKIDQVMVNLVNNAVKYAPKSKEIIVKVAHLDKATRVSVTDRGNGIPENQIKQLFDRFFRVKEQAAKTSGLGLGLFICAEIIRRHGGGIGVESKVGQGSTFWFTLPDAEDQNKI